jgi:HK97 family phage major capsid protein
MDISVLREEFNSLKTKSDALLSKAIEEKRDLTNEEKAESDNAFSRMQVIKDLDERNARFASDAFKSKDEKKIVLPTEVPGKEETEIEVKNSVKSLDFFKTAEGKKTFNSALDYWGKTAGDPRKKFAVTGATISSTTSNGIAYPKDVLDLITPTAPNTLVQALAAVGMSPLVTATTREITYPIALPTAGSTVSENATVETENPPGITGIDLKPTTFQSDTTWISELELQAVDFDMLSELLPALIYGRELAFEAAVMAQIAADSTITTHISAATDSGVTYANFVALNRALPKYYNSRKVIVVNKSVLSAMENLVSTTGQPLLTFNDPQNLDVRFFNGTPVVFTDYLNALGGSSGQVVGFVMSGLGFKVRYAGDQTVARYVNYSERPAQQGFNSFAFCCAGYDPRAIATLVLP